MQSINLIINYKLVREKRKRKIYYLMKHLIVSISINLSFNNLFTESFRSIKKKRSSNKHSFKYYTSNVKENSKILKKQIPILKLRVC